MHSKHKNSKTLGTQAAKVVTELHARRQPLFRIEDIVDITGLSAASARSFVHKLVNRGVVTRIKAGLYILVPFELGHESEYLGNPFVIARELIRGKAYYLSHSTAMDIHGMTTQPQMVIMVTTPKFMRPITTLGVEFRFIRCSQKHIFGVRNHWVSKQEQVCVSDLERTVIDGLRHPEYCGGITEVAKGLCMRKQDIKIVQLIDYAKRIGVGAVIRRLGFLLETYELANKSQIERLRKDLTSTYVRLDPILPEEGKYLHRWRLQLNVTQEELKAIVRT